MICAEIIEAAVFETAEHLEPRLVTARLSNHQALALDCFERGENKIENPTCRLTALGAELGELVPEAISSNTARRRVFRLQEPVQQTFGSGGSSGMESGCSFVLRR